MTVYVVLGIVAIALVGTAATIAIYLGLLNWLGGFHVVHCSTCHHLTGAATAQPATSCPHCRHPLLLHPFYATHHPGAPVRVRPDPLHY